MESSQLLCKKKEGEIDSWHGPSSKRSKKMWFSTFLLFFPNFWPEKKPNLVFGQPIGPKTVLKGQSMDVLENWLPRHFYPPVVVAGMPSGTRTRRKMCAAKMAYFLLTDYLGSCSFLSGKK